MNGTKSLSSEEKFLRYVVIVVFDLFPFCCILHVQLKFIYYRARFVESNVDMINGGFF